MDTLDEKKQLQIIMMLQNSFSDGRRLNALHDTGVAVHNAMSVMLDDIYPSVNAASKLAK